MFLEFGRHAMCRHRTMLDFWVDQLIAGLEGLRNSEPVAMVSFVGPVATSPTPRRSGGPSMTLLANPPQPGHSA